MTALTDTINSTSATSLLFESSRFTSTPLTSPSSRHESTSTTTPVSDHVTLSNLQPYRQAVKSNQPAGVDSTNIFTTYTDLLQQQRKSQAMLEQDLNGTGNALTGHSSVLNRYQTLQYRQNSAERMFNLKGNIFQHILNTAG